MAIFWNEVTIRWNEVTWNEVTMERSDRIPQLPVVFVTLSIFHSITFLRALQIDILDTR